MRFPRRVRRRGSVLRPTPLVGLLATAAIALGSCRPTDDLVAGEVTDNFDRDRVGPGWRDTGGGYGLVNGELAVRGAKGHPLWFRRRLPADVMIELDARAVSDDGALEIQLFGDGKATDPADNDCSSSGYTLLWRGTHAAICREREAPGGHHAARGDFPVVGGRTHHYAIIRRGAEIDWKVDGLAMLRWTDPHPLGGAGHDHFAITGHGTEAFFDELAIRPAPPAWP